MSHERNPIRSIRPLAICVFHYQGRLYPDGLQELLGQRGLL
jgi:hypothetical protein